MTSTRKGRPASPSAPSQAGQERWRLQIGRYEPRNDNIVNILSDYVVQFAARTPPGYDSTHLVDRQEAIDTPFQVSTRYLERKSLQSLRLEAGRPSEASDGLSVPRSSVCRRSCGSMPAGLGCCKTDPQTLDITLHDSGRFLTAPEASHVG